MAKTCWGKEGGKHNQPNSSLTHFNTVTKPSGELTRSEKHQWSWAYWSRDIIPALERWRQEELKFKAVSSYSKFKARHGYSKQKAMQYWIWEGESFLDLFTPITYKHVQ